MFFGTIRRDLMRQNFEFLLSRSNIEGQRSNIETLYKKIFLIERWSVNQIYNAMLVFMYWWKLRYHLQDSMQAYKKMSWEKLFQLHQDQSNFQPPETKRWKVCLIDFHVINLYQHIVRKYEPDFCELL